MPLAPLARKGAAVGMLHPLAAFPPAGSKAPFPRGIGFAVGGQRRAVAGARRLARALGGRPFNLSVRARPAYHLAASILANDTTVLAFLAESLLQKERSNRRPALREAMSRLLETVAQRIREEGPSRALTGPAARGDAITLQRHMAILTRREGSIREIHALLSLEALHIAARSGALSPAQIELARGALRKKRAKRR